MPNKSRHLGAFAVICILLLISSVTAVPLETSESTKDLLDAEELAKSVTVDLAPRVGADGTTTLGVTLGSTDPRYQVLNGKSFTVDPEKTDGGVDFTVGSTDATVTGLMSGARAHIPRMLDGANITDPAVFDSETFDRMALTEVVGLVADKPISSKDPASSFMTTSLGVAPSTTSVPTYRQAVSAALMSTTETSYLSALTSNVGGTTGDTPKKSWWQWTKQKAKTSWKATKNWTGMAWSSTKEFVKEHWVAILIVVIAIIIVTVIVLLLLWFFLAPPPITVPIVMEVITPLVKMAVIGVISAAVMKEVRRSLRSNSTLESGFDTSLESRYPLIF
jgi:hypothetical protein